MVCVEIYWTALAVDEYLVDPDWWPKCGKVPGYTQLIIGSGATDIFLLALHSMFFQLMVDIYWYSYRYLW